MNQEIQKKAEYCLNCKTKPCQKGCPLENDIPQFIQYIKEEKYKEAYQVLAKTTVLSSVCGRICPHESQCQGGCVRRLKGEPTSIGKLEAFVADKALQENYAFEEEMMNRKRQKVAVVGGGPAGLTCSAFLARKGYRVTIFEKQDTLGGILTHGIPEFRLDREVLQGSIRKILDLGIEVKYRQILGKTVTLEQLEEQYDAVFISIGANIPTKMQISGEEIEGVYGGNTLLEENKHPIYQEKTVAVIGGGNVAMDCARTIKRLGAKEVFIIYRRAQEQMPAERKEIEEAMQEGITFLFQTNVIKIIPNIKQNKVEKIECIKTQLIQKEGDLRPSPVDIEDSNFLLPMDYVVMAIGSVPEKTIMQSLTIEKTKKGYISVQEGYRTSHEKVFAGGDVIGQKATVAWAARSGRKAAEEIDNYIKSTH
ncbi:MAG: FAD-dependent oxidoreductase [Clostridia bacterium]